MKTLLVLENDSVLKKYEHYHSYRFMEEFKNDNKDCEVILFTSLSSKTNQEIFQAVTNCTDIVVQTCFINGSDNQAYDMFKLLSKIKESKNIHIRLLGENLYDWFVNNFSDEEFYSIQQHKIYDFEYDYVDDEKVLVHKLLDFSDKINNYQTVLNEKERVRKFEYEYSQSAKDRPTGQKVKILRCLANGNAFKNLPIGEVVDVLDMSTLDPNKNRGVWVWGNGEPIKLVVDNGYNEYELVVDKTESTKDIINNITKILDYNIDDLKVSEYKELHEIIEDNEISSIEKATEICDLLKIERRNNRSNIVKLL